MWLITVMESKHPDRNKNSFSILVVPRIESVTFSSGAVLTKPIHRNRQIMHCWMDIMWNVDIDQLKLSLANQLANLVDEIVNFDLYRVK